MSTSTQWPFKKKRQEAGESGETETPLIPFAEKLLFEQEMTSGRIPVPQACTADYAGHLLAWFLAQEGIQVPGDIHRGTAKERDAKCLVWRTPAPLCQVIEKLLRYSNNFMANQLFLTMGATVYSPPATLSKGIRVMHTCLGRLGVSALPIVEGSGISRQNRISAREMLVVLKAFSSWRHLMRHENGMFYKTGTLEDVCARCGYMEGMDGRLFPFALMINKKGASPAPILRAMKRKTAVWSAIAPHSRGEAKR